MEIKHPQLVAGWLGYRNGHLYNLEVIIIITYGDKSMDITAPRSNAKTADEKINVECIMIQRTGVF